jgi:hypothetical protein
LIDDPTAVTTVRRDWAADEAAAPGVWRELERLGRRARRRWLRTVAYALACAALVVGAAASRPRSYASRIVFRVTPAADARLRDYVTGVVFRRAQLAAVIARVGRYPSPAARDSGLGVDALREHVDVDVGRSGDDPPGSARLAVTFRGDDAQKVYDTITQLGLLVVDAQPRGRRFEVVDAGHVEPEGIGRVALLAWLGLCAWLLALPLCAVAVAAFDPRIYDLDDVRRLGLPTVGAVRPFEGDNAGALAARLRDDGRGRIAPP